MSALKGLVNTNNPFRMNPVEDLICRIGFAHFGQMDLFPQPIDQGEHVGVYGKSRPLVAQVIQGNEISPLTLQLSRALSMPPSVSIANSGVCPSLRAPSAAAISGFSTS